MPLDHALFPGLGNATAGLHGHQDAAFPESRLEVLGILLGDAQADQGAERTGGRSLGGLGPAPFGNRLLLLPVAHRDADLLLPEPGCGQPLDGGFGRGPIAKQTDHRAAERPSCSSRRAATPAHRMSGGNEAKLVPGTRPGGDRGYPLRGGAFPALAIVGTEG